MASRATALETPRLLLRQWREKDLEPFAAINADPQVMHYLGGSTLTKEQSDSLAERIRLHFHEHGFGLWAVEVKHEATMAGFIGLAYPDFPARDHADDRDRVAPVQRVLGKRPRHRRRRRVHALRVRVALLRCPL